MWTDFVVAMLSALAVTAAYAAIAGDVSRAEALPAFFLVVLVVWAAGIWLTPFGPVFWGGAWLTLIAPAALMLLLLLALTSKRPSPRHKRMDAVNDETAAKSLAVLSVSVLLVLLLAGLVVAIAAAYA
jgi:hypothetical protein